MLRAHLFIRVLPFKPSAELEAIHGKAAPEALEYMIDEYHRVLNPPFFKGKKWSSLMPPGAKETDWSYEFPTHFDYHGRGALYYAIISSVKNYGSATFYFGPKAPKGKESNWLPTDPKRRFFLLARFYGPKPEIVNGSFVLNDMERID